MASQGASRGCKPRSWCSARAASSGPTCCCGCSSIRSDVYGTAAARRPGGSRTCSSRSTSARSTCSSTSTSTRCSTRCSRAPSSTASRTARTRSRPTAELIYRTNFDSSPGRWSSGSQARAIAALRPRRQLVGVRRQRRRRPTSTTSLAPNSDYAVSKVAAANLLHYFGHRSGIALREPPALLGLRPARGLVAADPERRSGTGLEGELPRLRRPDDLARLRLRRRRLRGVRRRCAEPARRGLRRVVQHRQRHARPRSARSRRRLASSSASTAEPAFTHARAPLGRAGLVRQHRARRASGSGGSRDRASATASSGRPSGTGRLPDKERYVAVVEEVRRSTRNTASAPSSPATRTARRSRSCTSGCRATFTKLNDRLRDHLRQRLQPRRLRGGHPRDLARTTGASSASRTRGTSARRRRSAAAWRSRRRTRACCSTATCRTRPS